MTNNDQSPVARHVRRLAGLPRTGDLTDAQLLERFAAQRDGTAFAALMNRHGPKVFGLCQRVLRHRQDAEDAFQATFLVLVRKAGSIGRRESVGSWLHRVAYRVALRARILADKRIRQETSTLEVPATERTPDLVWEDLRTVLDEEVDRLPAKYRIPFILCYLDGKTNEEAARELGCPHGTVLSRLAAARERLRTRLTLRGLTLSAGLLTARLTTANAAVPVPATLAEATSRAALLSTGRADAGTVSAPVLSLMKGALRTMVWTKGKILSVCLLAAGVLGVSGMLARPTGQGGAVAAQAASGPVARTEVPDPPARADDKKKVEDKLSKKEHEFKAAEMPWKDALDWLREISGKPVMLNDNQPTGSLSFNGPRGVKYSVRDTIDIFNESLLVQKMYLLDRGATFTIIAADQKLDPASVPLINIDDLDKRGRTELVRVVISLKSLNAEDVAPTLEKIMGPFGNATHSGNNQLMLTDTVANIQFVRKTIKEMESNGHVDRPIYTHKCVFIKARDAERILKEALGDPRDPRAAPALRSFSIACDEAQNTIAVTGPADKIAQAKQILERLDTHTPGNEGPSAAVIRAYAVPTGNAEAIVKTLKEGYAKNVKIRIEAAGSNQILVYANPEDQSEIAALIGKGIKPEPKTFAFDMADKPWKHVFEWYADQTGLPFVGTNVPTGTFTFIGPRNKKYTLEEITDILNEALLAQKFILVRRAASFTVLPADEKIDPTLLPRVSLDDLEKRGRTELVTVMMPLKRKASEIAPDVKKLLGPFGSVVVLENANQLLLQDTAGNLRQICQTIKEIETRDPGRNLAPEKPK